MFPIHDGDLVLDAEVIGVDPTGRHRFEYVGDSAMIHMLVVFDVLVLRGRSLMHERWSTRRDALEDLGLSGPRVFSTPVSDEAEPMMAYFATSARWDRASPPSRRSGEHGRRSVAH